MVDLTPAGLLNFLLPHFEQPNGGPRIAHRHLCQRLRDAVIMEESRNDEFQNFISNFVELAREEDDRIDITTANESNVQMRALKLSVVYKLHRMWTRRVDRKHLKKHIRKGLKWYSYSEVKSWEYIVVWTRIHDRLQIPSFQSLNVCIGYDSIRFRLSRGQGNAHIIFNIEFYPYRGNGCQIVVYMENDMNNRIIGERNVSNIEGINYNDMAASEFCEIIRPLMGTSPKLSLDFLLIDIDPFRPEVPWKLPNVMFSRKIKYWMKGHGQRINASFAQLQLYIREIDQIPPLNLRFLEPDSLFTLHLRLWSNLNFDAVPPPHYPWILESWDKTEHWKLSSLDINDPLLQHFNPDITRCRQVTVFLIDRWRLAFYVHLFTRTAANCFIQTTLGEPNGQNLRLTLVFTPGICWMFFPDQEERAVFLPLDPEFGYFFRRGPVPPNMLRNF